MNSVQVADSAGLASIQASRLNQRLPTNKLSNLVGWTSCPPLTTGGRDAHPTRSMSIFYLEVPKRHFYTHTKYADLVVFILKSDFFFNKYLCKQS